MFTIIFIMATGVAVGYLFRRLPFLQGVNKSIPPTIWLLLLTLGVSVGLLGHLQQRIQIGTEPIIADVPYIMLRPPGIPDVQSSVFQKGDNLKRTCIGLIKLNTHRYKNKTTPDLSIVERLGGSGTAKIQRQFHTTKPLRMFLRHANTSL